jgi:3-deoxy-D-manno-octulosonic-acid transferase
LIYNLSIRVYYLGVYIASFFSPKAKSWIEGRRKTHARLGNYTESAHGRKIWVHCASLGEFEQARPLIEKIRQLHPDYHLVLTFFSPSGFDARRYYEGVDFIGYLPLDTAADARRFIRKLRPSLVIWVKYEYWYHILSQLHLRNIPIVLISSVFRQDSIFFKWYGSLHREMLGCFTKIFVQNEPSQALLHTLGVASEVCPDTRFDSVYNVMDRHKHIHSIAAFKDSKKIFIAGSTWERDADMICDLVNNEAFDKKFKYIIAPHHVTAHNTEYLLKKIKRKKVLLSRMLLQNAAKYDVVIVDSMGLLSSLYFYGDIAYVGGGFNTSVHNILEPAVYGMPVLFGPNYHKSEEAKALLSHPDWHAAYTVKSAAEVIATVRSLLDNEGRNLKTASLRSKEYVLDHTGGTEKIYSYLTGQNLLR